MKKYMHWPSFLVWLFGLFCVFHGPTKVAEWYMERQPGFGDMPSLQYELGVPWLPPVGAALACLAVWTWSRQWRRQRFAETTLKRI